MAETITMRKAGAVSDLLALAESIKNKLDTEIVCNISKANNTAIMICCEEYYFRVSNYVSLTILLTQESSSQDAVIVGFGGGSSLSNVSWGANKAYAKKAQKALQELGFTDTMP